jgi:ribulose-5-phosphate 4-epimerase/fuculose-1-phosphate aldolase
MDDVLDDLTKGWRFLYRRGFIEGFGHISGRLPGGDSFLLARHSLGPRPERDDFLTIDFEGRQLAGVGDPPGEYPIHLEILRQRSDVGCVIHYHGLYSTAFTTAQGQALRPIHLMGTLFHDGIPVHPDPRLISTRERGEALVATLGPHRAVLLRAHGAVIIGANVREAVAGAFLFEENARRAWASAPLGGPVWLESDLAADAGAELLAGGGPFRRVWALVESDWQEDGQEAVEQRP